MTTYADTYAVKELLARLETMREELSAAVLKGTPRDWTEYRERVAALRTVDDLRTMIVDVVRAMNGPQDRTHR